MGVLHKSNYRKNISSQGLVISGSNLQVFLNGIGHLSIACAYLKSLRKLSIVKT